LALSRALAKAFCSAVFLRRTQAALASGAPAQVGARFAGPVSLQELADATGLGVRHLSRAFREATGRSPHQYLLHRRVEAAKVLIRQGLPLAEVAGQCGFSDQSQLTRTFIRHAGTTPGRFRNRHAS
jgi:AraC family transcriptional regulator